MARNETTLKPNQRIALTHGATSQKALQQQHRRIRAQSRSALISLKPELSRDEFRHELELGVDALVRLEAIRRWTAQMGGHVTTNGQLRRGGVTEHESAAAEFDRWARRNQVGAGYQSAPNSASTKAAEQEEATAAHKRLREQYNRKEDAK